MCVRICAAVGQLHSSDQLRGTAWTGASWGRPWRYEDTCTQVPGYPPPPRSSSAAATWECKCAGAPAGQAGRQGTHSTLTYPHPHPQGQGSFPGRDATAASNLFFRLSTSSSAVTQIKPTWADRLYPGRPVYHLAALHHPPGSALGTCTQYLPACLPACLPPLSLSLSPSFASRALFCADTPSGPGRFMYPTPNPGHSHSHTPPARHTTLQGHIAAMPANASP